MHQNVLKHLIYIYDGSVIHSEVVPGLNYVIVVQFVPSCYPGLASSTRLQGVDEVRMHPYNYPLHCMLLKQYIYI